MLKRKEKKKLLPLTEFQKLPFFLHNEAKFRIFWKRYINLPCHKNRDQMRILTSLRRNDVSGRSNFENFTRDERGGHENRETFTPLCVFHSTYSYLLSDIVFFLFFLLFFFFEAIYLSILYRNMHNLYYNCNLCHNYGISNILQWKRKGKIQCKYYECKY